MTAAELMLCGLWIQRWKAGRATAAETMAASQRRSQPIGVVLSNDVE